MTQFSSERTGQQTPVKKSLISDAERAFQANAAYPASPITSVDDNTGNWTTVGKPKEFNNRLEIYVLKRIESLIFGAA